MFERHTVCQANVFSREEVCYNNEKVKKEFMRENPRGSALTFGGEYLGNARSNQRQPGDPKAK